MRDPAGADRPGPPSRVRSLLGLAFVIGLGAYIVADDLVYYATQGTILFDAHAYWLTGQEGFVPYSLDPGYTDAYLYSPAFAQAIAVVTWLPWPVFAGLWVAAELAAFMWLLRPLGWLWTAAWLVWCLPELVIGNIYGFLAVAVVLALTRWPAAWALPVLTKPVLGVGILWHVARGEWRAMALALGSIAAVVAVSLPLDPGYWVAWVDFLVRVSGESTDITLLVRVTLSSAAIVVAARGGRAWVVPFALVLALPVTGGPSVLTILAAVPRLWAEGNTSARHEPESG